MVSAFTIGVTEVVPALWCSCMDGPVTPPSGADSIRFANGIALCWWTCLGMVRVAPR